MIATEKPKKLAAQACPLCGNWQDIIINGWEPVEGDKRGLLVSEDHGYSFCNCHNIFFTDWNNINQGTYDPDYYKKYDSEIINNSYKNTFKRAYPKLDLEIIAIQPSVLEIGSINPTILDLFKEKGFKTHGLDIYDHPLGDHKLLIGNFESKDYQVTGKYDCIWASHVFEHFKDPIEAVKKCNELLKDDGTLYIAMPDPWFIDFSNPYAWGHWHLREHHILWDMDSFAEVLRNNGFEILSKERNTNLDQICVMDFSIVAKKRIDVKHYNKSI